MFFVRPIARDDLPAVFTLSERSGAGLTTLPANRERLSERIDRSLASFAGTADRGDACYVFVLIDSRDERVVGICDLGTRVDEGGEVYISRRDTRAHASRTLSLYADTAALCRPQYHTTY